MMVVSAKGAIAGHFVFLVARLEKPENHRQLLKNCHSLAQLPHSLTSNQSLGPFVNSASYLSFTHCYHPRPGYAFIHPLIHSLIINAECLPCDKAEQQGLRMQR